jgi:lysylphosphatidylglycerol synthase-like protein
VKTRGRIAAGLLTLVILALIARRIPLAAVVAAFRGVDYVEFLAIMVPNTVFYFCWDTLVLTTAIRWFHGNVPYRDLLPVRAASYVVGFFNTQVGRGALAAYLWRRLDLPFLELGGTVMFLVLAEYLHLVMWAMLGVLGFRQEITTDLLVVAGGVAALWIAFFGYTRLQITPVRALRWLFAPREWQLLRTFRRASATRYLQIIVLRMPMFVVSLFAHYYAAHAFGIHIPLGQLLTFLPVIFMAAALPVTVAHLGTTQVAWIFFFGQHVPAPRLLAFSLAAHLTFTLTRALLGVIWLPIAYADLTASVRRRPHLASAR